MITDVKVRYEKLQYDINRKVAKISVLLSGKIDKIEYLTGKETLLILKGKNQGVDLN